MRNAQLVKPAAAARAPASAPARAPERSSGAAPPAIRRAQSCACGGGCSKCAGGAGKQMPTIQRAAASGVIMRTPCADDCGKSMEESAGDASARLAAMSSCIRQCPAEDAPATPADPGAAPQPAQNAAAEPALPVRAAAAAPVAAAEEPPFKAADMLVPWTAPVPDQYPLAVIDKRVWHPKPPKYMGNPALPVGWRYHNGKPTRLGRQLCEECTKDAPIGLFTQFLDNEKPVSVRCEWHNYSELPNKKTGIVEKVPGFYKGGSELLPDLPKKPTAKKPALQRKVRLGPPGDHLEREADAVAEQVMRMPQATPLAASDGAARPGMQRDSAPGAAATPDTSLAARVAGQDGAPLGAGARSFFEARMGHDLSGVRVHTGPDAAAAARSVQARAYTLGADIVFGAAEYAPDSDSGKRLMAHELTHVVQQGAARPRQSGEGAIQRDAAPDVAAGPLAAPLTDSEWHGVNIWLSRGEVAGEPLTGDPDHNAAVVAASIFCSRALGSSEFQGKDLPPVCMFSALANDEPRAMAIKLDVMAKGPIINWPAVPAGDRMTHVMERLVDQEKYPVNAAAGIVGNLLAESHVLPSIVEGGNEAAPMRAPAAGGRMKDFTPDEVRDRGDGKGAGPKLPGVGLAQWTTPERREGLFAEPAAGVSVLFDMDAQVDHLVSELQALSGLNGRLKAAGVSLDAASDNIVYEFEIPGALLGAGGKILPRTDPAVQAVFNTRRNNGNAALRAFRKTHPE
jgi:hypothetical protein